MKRFLWLVAGAALAACASLGGPRVITFSEADIAEQLARRFPLEQRLLDWLDVKVATPRVRLVPERNRLATELDFSAAERFTGRPLRGAIALDHALRYEPLDGTVRLTQVRVDRVQLDTGAAALPLTAQRLGGLLAERLLDDAVIWRADAKQLDRLRAAGVATGAVTVTSRGVEVTLAPTK